jgi:Family of unknown function (DUF6504)
MRRYDDPVEVRRGSDAEPEQFLWRGRLWKVRAVLAHWVETGPWWQTSGARAVIGSHEPDGKGPTPLGDLITERELWRVEAGRGARVGGAGEPDGGGVFDLSLDWADGRWSLTGCAD